MIPIISDPLAMIRMASDSFINDELKKAHTKSAREQVNSNPARIPCPGPQKGHSAVEYAWAVLLPAMISLAQNNYQNGYLADCTVDVESLRPWRQELIKYCRDRNLKLPDECRDESGNASVGAWVGLVMAHSAPPNTITVHSFERGMDNVPHIRLTLS